MGDGGAMDSGTAKQLHWAMGWRHFDGRHNKRPTITADTEAVLWEAMQDGRQQQSRWMAVA